MAIKLELHRVEHPFKLCYNCNDALGWNCVTLEPGSPIQRQLFVCDEDLGNFFKEFGDSIITKFKEEKGND